MPDPRKIHQFKGLRLRGLALCAGFLLVASPAWGQLPAGWAATDIGSPGEPGSAVESAGAWSVSGGGSDIWNASDQFHFVHRTLRGDGTVLARVDAVGNTNPWAKSGVMMRASAAADAAYADVVVTPSNSVVFQWRTTAGGDAETISAGGTVSAPVWVRLERCGESVAGSFSCDGVHWVQVGGPEPVELGPAAAVGLAVCAGDNAALSGSNFSQVAVVPAGWEDREVGSPPVAGSAVFDGETVTVSGSGEVFGTTDQFHLTSQQFVGDVEVVARVDSITGGGAYAKAGVMIREGVAADASYAFSFVTPDTGAGGQGANFEYRDGAGSAAQSAANAGGEAAPQWVKLIRQGDVFTAYRSVDGVSWVQNGPAVSIVMGATVQVGVAVSGGGPVLCTADFSSLRVLPLEWSAIDIGAPGIAGSACFDGLRWKVNGGGEDIWNSTDQFQFARRSFTGDVTILAKVRSISNTGEFAKAGLMIRENAGADSRYAFAFLTPDNPQPYAGALFEYREIAGGTAQGGGNTAGVLAPSWLKLERVGDLFTAHHSADGVAWTQFGSVTIAMDATVQVGLAVCANDDAALSSAAFDHVFVGKDYRDPLLRADGIHFKNDRGTGDIVDLRGTNTGGWLLHEIWINGVDNSGLPDDLSVRDTLESRFGTATANRCLAAFEDHWITARDLDNMRALGLNVLRVPFSYRCVFDSSWNWRSDAFTQLDWVVDEAWKRGIYVILDLHGAPGGASPWQSSGIDGGGALWTDTFLQDRAVEIWSQLAEHYAGHPGIAAYDLINEPVPPSYAAMWSLYDRMYDAIRAVDPDHVVMMEGGGGPGVGGSFWSVDTLPSPASQGWTNVAYQTHAYALDGGTDAENTANWQVIQLGFHGVPLLIGEFNLGDRQSFGVQLWDDNDLNWTSWTYKVRHWVGSEWGIYWVTSWPAEANLQTDSAEDIIAAYATVTTEQHFDLNPGFRDIFGTPFLVDDRYQTQPDQPLYVAPPSGVLANDTIPNLGQPGITPNAYEVDGPAHGTLTLWGDGSFYYTPDAGFSGTDTFRYFVWDNVNDSANIATVRVEVVAIEGAWTAAEVGPPGVLGSSEYDPLADTWTVRGGGADIYGTSDQFRIVSQDLANDGGILAHVTSVENTHAYAKAGVMLRESTAADAPYAFVFATPTTVSFETRQSTGASATTSASIPATTPVWVKLTRTGADFTAWWSDDGVTWNSLGTQAMSVPATLKAGLAVTAHDNATLNTSTFGNVLVFPVLPPDPGVEWQQLHFGGDWDNPAIAGDLVDPDRDKHFNLVERALVGDPNASDSPALVEVAIAGDRLEISFQRDTSNTDLVITVQGGDSPAGPWADLARSTAGGAFAALMAGVTVNESGVGEIRTVTVGDVHLIAEPGHPERYLRVAVTRQWRFTALPVPGGKP